MELINISITEKIPEFQQLHFENTLINAGSVTKKIVFPIACSFAVICCFIICFIIIKTGVKRASKVYIILLSATDIIQSLGLIG